MDDPVLLSRLQFAITIMFHYIFPPMTIGLGVVLVALEGLWLKTKNDLYHKQAKFWTRIFGIIFALGVASGIVMEFQFGTNWADYSRCVGDIFGSPLAAEGIFAFFLESGFLAILLFGWDKVGPKMHFLSSCMVALGAHFSAIWIIVANSWMQTPAGYKLVEVNGKIQAHITSFYDVVFNPSTVDRLTHALAGCWLGGGSHARPQRLRLVYFEKTFYRRIGKKLQGGIGHRPHRRGWHGHHGRFQRTRSLRPPACQIRGYGRRHGIRRPSGPPSHRLDEPVHP